MTGSYVMDDALLERTILDGQVSALRAFRDVLAESSLAWPAGHDSRVRVADVLDLLDGCISRTESERADG